MKNKLVFLTLSGLLLTGCFNFSRNSSSNEASFSSESSSERTFEDIPLDYGISISRSNDYNDYDYLTTNVTYQCYADVYYENTLTGDPIFIYDDTYADIFYPRISDGIGTVMFYIAVKDVPTDSFEFTIEFRTQTLTKTYEIVENEIDAVCLFDIETSYGYNMPDYGNLTIIDTEYRYNELKDLFSKHYTYPFPDMDFTNHFLIINYFYVSCYRNYYTFNQCFTLENDFYVDDKCAFYDEDITFNVTGVHFTIIQVSNEYKHCTFHGHRSYVLPPEK